MTTAGINKWTCRVYGVLFLCLAVVLAAGGLKLIVFGLDGLPGVPREQIPPGFEMSFVYNGLAICVGALIPAAIGVLAYRRHLWAMVLGIALFVLNIVIMTEGFDLFDFAALAIFVGLTIVAVFSGPRVVGPSDQPAKS